MARERGREAALAALRGRGMLCEELALVASLREVVRDIAREEDLPALRRAARALGHDVVISTERVILHPAGSFQRVPPGQPGADHRIVYLGAREACVRARAAEAEGRLGRLGALLGYPECCIGHYLACEPRELVARIHAVSPSHDIHAHSLLRGVTGHGFVSHFPCSFACPPSVALGREVRRLLAAEDPGYERESVRYLSSPLLYLGDGREVVLLDGRVRGRAVSGFSEALRSASMPLPDFDRVRIEGDEVVLLHGRGIARRVPRGTGPCILFRFEDGGTRPAGAHGLPR